MKMYCKIKRPDNASYGYKKGQEVIIQEKIDGSNTAIYNDNGNIRLYSRQNELKGEEGLGGFVSWIRKKEDKIKEFLPVGWVLYGEWLEQGKINYNSLAKQGKIEPYYAFDVISGIKLKDNCKEEDEDKYEREWESIDTMIDIANKIGLKTVPELARIKFTDYKDLEAKYVKDQKSALEGTDCIREGIVIKTPDGAGRLKIVGDSFKEVKKIKNSVTASPYAFVDKYITPARINKFLNTIEIEPKFENMTKILRQLDVIAEDILEEEKEQILIDIKRIIRKETPANIREYIASTIKEGENNDN